MGLWINWITDPDATNDNRVDQNTLHTICFYSEGLCRKKLISVIHLLALRSPMLAPVFRWIDIPKYYVSLILLPRMTGASAQQRWRQMRRGDDCPPAGGGIDS